MDSSSTTQSFSLPQIHPISVKLDRSNYNFWKTQVFATARAFGFEDVLKADDVPQQFNPSASSTAVSTPNPEYLVWIRRDQFIFSWLLASISPSMVGYVGQCTSSAQLWSTFEVLFHSQSKARSMQLKYQLQTLKKGGSSIDDYILKFRDISDQLCSIGQPIADSDLVTYVLAGLGPEYKSICVFLQAKCEELSLHEVQFALLLRLQNQAAASSFSPQAHVASQNQQANVAYQNSGYRGRGRFGHRGGFSTRGRGDRSNGGNSGNKIVCQLCGKSNHVAIKCFRRFDVSFTGIESSPQPPSQAYLTTSPTQQISSPFPHPP